MAGPIVRAIRDEYLRYRALAEAAMLQIADEDLHKAAGDSGNSIAVICQHVGGNLKSRFTDFLTTDGEKPWRQREEEFRDHSPSRSEMLVIWNAGWEALLAALEPLTDDDLQRTVLIRQQPIRVYEALPRSLAHTSYHCGQIVYIAKTVRGARWTYLSIPPGGAEAYNRNPELDRPAAQADAIARKVGSKA